MDNALILERVLNLIVLLLSLTFHEFFHAWSAWRLGDDTAARLGRLTLNPVPHIDPVGTLLLPLLGAPIGWAKPVPVNPANFRRSVRQSTGDILVSAAGPLSNLVLGAVAAIALGVVFRVSPEAVRPGGGLLEFLQRLMIVNAGLAIFNLLPVPPLDGSHVAEHLVPARLRPVWEQFARFSPFFLIALILFGRSIIYPPVFFVFGLLQQLTLSIAT
ncbi:MAG TPA: site-2 protease family protein [Anaeromyxobacter sp.]|nr:site-2 protease family protein [Anaeromyxobacter sp.]